MFYAQNEKWRMPNNRWKQLINQERIRTLEEKENYLYIVILVGDTIKHIEMKGKQMVY